MIDDNVKRVLAAKLRSNAMAVYKGMLAVQNLTELTSQFNLLNGSELENDDTLVNEPDYSDAVPVTGGDLYNAFNALVNVQTAVGGAMAGVSEDDFNAIRKLNILL